MTLNTIGPVKTSLNINFVMFRLLTASPSVTGGLTEPAATYPEDIAIYAV